MEAMCTSHRRCLAAVLVVLCFAGTQAAHAQRGITNPQTWDPGLGLIKLDVVVTDGSGTPVPGLSLKDFALLDHGEPNRILSFRAFDGVLTKPSPPVEIILVIDTLHLPTSLVRNERDAVEAFLRRNGGHLAAPASVFTLVDMGLWQVGQTSSDGNSLATAVVHNSELGLIRHLSGGLTSNPSLDALMSLGAIASAERQKPGRKLLLWVGPGWGVGSGVPLPDTAPNEHTFYTICWFSTLLREARITLYNFAVGQSAPAQLYMGYLRGVESVKQATPMNLFRSVLAVESGGRVLDKSYDLVSQMESCVRDASAFYTVSFDPSHADHVDEYHPLQVRISRPGLTARTSTGYYDQPFYSDQRSPSIQRITVAQLERFLESNRGDGDGNVAKQLSAMELTERLSDTKLASLTTAMGGKKSQQALAALADDAAFLPFPPAEIPAEAAPDAAEQRRLVLLAADYLKNTMPRLPNFYATRTTVRYEETAQFDAVDRKINYARLRATENYKETVTYRDGSEIADSGGKHRKREVNDPYMITYGTFGPVLGFVRDAITTPGVLAWDRWEQSAGVRRAVFRFTIPARISLFRTEGCCLPDGSGTIGFDTLPRYHGEMAIDPASGAILHLQAEADLEGFPPVSRSTIMVTYGPVEIGGKHYICPLKSVSFMKSRSVIVLMYGDEGFRTYGPYQALVNDISYGDYHVARGESRLIPGFTPEKGESLPGSGSSPH